MFSEIDGLLAFNKMTDMFSSVSVIEERWGGEVPLELSDDVFTAARMDRKTVWVSFLRLWGIYDPIKDEVISLNMNKIEPTHEKWRNWILSHPDIGISKTERVKTKKIMKLQRSLFR